MWNNNHNAHRPAGQHPTPLHIPSGRRTRYQLTYISPPSPSFTATTPNTHRAFVAVMKCVHACARVQTHARSQLAVHTYDVFFLEDLRFGFPSRRGGVRNVGAVALAGDSDNDPLGVECRGPDEGGARRGLTLMVWAVVGRLDTDGV